MIGLIVDALIMALLLATLALGLWLHLRLAALQAGRLEIDQLVTRLDQVTGAAASASAELKSVAADADACITARIETARHLADELRLLSDRADRAAEQLSLAIQSAREPAGRALAEPHATKEAAAKPARAEIEWALSRLR